MSKNYLEHILERKYKEAATLPEPKRFSQVLKGDALAVIAEIKRKSPSKGELCAHLDPVLLAKQYVAGGAAAISVLTDQIGFGGSLDDLRAVIKACPGVPILRKDFIVDHKQIDETARSGAHALLLIVAALKERLPEFIRMSKEYGLDALVEVHDQIELKIALDAGAEIIGINNRNLTTFTTSIQTSLDLIKEIPEEIIKVSESAIDTPETAHILRNVGFDVVLVGEALVKSSAPQQLIKEMRQC